MRLMLVAVLTLSCSQALGHSFYERRCCSGDDCAPATKVELDPAGGEWITTKHGRVWAPLSPTPAFGADRILPSPDGRTHACILNGKLICVYRAPGT